MRVLPDLAARRVRQRPLSRDEIDADLVPPVWGRAVYGNRDLPSGAVDRDAYMLCVLEQLRVVLRRRDIFAAPSLRWADPRAMLLHGPDQDRILVARLTGMARRHARWRELTVADLRELAAWRRPCFGPPSEQPNAIPRPPGFP